MKRVALAALCGAALACGQPEQPGEIAGERLPEPVLAARAQAQADAVAGLDLVEGVARPSQQILFGDLHTHTTYSGDAATWSLPMVAGDGAHPPADACDFARYCAGLDFFGITDHAETSTPERWRETVASLRACDARAGDPAGPDLVAFLGFEWSQAGRTPKTHYGHRNVLLRSLRDGEIPARPIAAPLDFVADVFEPPSPVLAPALGLLDLRHFSAYADFGRRQRETAAVALCPQGVASTALPSDCRELAATPRELFEKLDPWGADALVIPTGMGDGRYAPPGASWDAALADGQTDPARQMLLEVYAGHGSSEQYRDRSEVVYDAEGAAACPEPTFEYTPCCWQAGEIVRRRCADPASAPCAALVAEARRNAAEAGILYHQTLPGTTLRDWGECGQCRECSLPTFGFRPEASLQAALARPGVRFGVIASGGSHSARPGAGYKQRERRRTTDAVGPADAGWAARLYGSPRAPEARSTPRSDFRSSQLLFQILHAERATSFLSSGGLVAVHASGRDRDSIWRALRRGEVYGTSGPRILLWFDLVNGAVPLPMGSDVALDEIPRFRVRAVGSQQEQAGCADHAHAGLPAARLEHLCRSECHHPGAARRRITRVEIVRIRTQADPGEPLASLVEDPWVALDCDAEPAGCVIELQDPDWAAQPRETVYYARAIEEPAPTINAGNLRCEYDDDLRCVQVHPCYADYRTPEGDDCLAPAEPRAWSSPIRVRPADAA